MAEGDINEITKSFTTFLRKSEVENENAKRRAEDQLRLTRRHRIAGDCLAEARRKINQPPFLSLPEALMQLVSQQGFPLTKEEAIEFIQKADQQAVSRNYPPILVSQSSDPPIAHLSQSRQVRTLNPEAPENLTFTRIIEGHFDNQSIAIWNDLVDCAIRTTLTKGILFQEVNNIVTAMQLGIRTDAGYRSVRDTEPQCSVQGVEANQAWKKSLLLAKKAKVEITVRFRWGNNPNAAHGGEEGLLRWSP